MKIRKCNMCGKEVEHYNDFGLHYRFGYESFRDGDIIDLDLCGKCLDEFVDGILKKCKLNPIEGVLVK